MTVRWGFLGAGFVASKGMAPAVHDAHLATLFGVASRDAARSAQLEPENVYGSYDELLADPRVQAVYISLANSQHLEWVEKSLRAGKHVLCEKPLGLNAQEVRSMFATAGECGVMLVEAVWAQWHPRFQRLVDVVSSGAIGDVEAITSRFTFMSDMTNNYRLNPQMGGGALLDVGCYQVHAWAALTGGASVCALAGVHRELGESGVDLTTEVAAVVNGATAVRATSSFALPASQELEVRGSLGKVHMGEGEAFSSWNEATTLVLNGEVEHFASVNAFEVMVNSVSQLIMGENGWCVSLEQSVRVAEVLDEIQSF